MWRFWVVIQRKERIVLHLWAFLLICTWCSCATNHKDNLEIMHFWTAIGSQHLEWFGTSCCVRRLANGPINRIGKFCFDWWCYDDAIDESARCFDIFHVSHKHLSFLIRWPRYLEKYKNIYYNSNDKVIKKSSYLIKPRQRGGNSTRLQTRRSWVRSPHGTGFYIFQVSHLFFFCFLFFLSPILLIMM